MDKLPDFYISYGEKYRIWVEDTSCTKANGPERAASLNGPSLVRVQQEKIRIFRSICPSSVFTKVIWLRFLPFSSQSSLPTRWHLHLHPPPLLPLYRSGPFLLTLAFNFNIWLNTKNRGRGSTWGSGLTGKDTCTQIRFFLCIPDTPAMSYMSTRLAKCSMDRGLVVLRVSWSRHPELSKKNQGREQILILQIIFPGKITTIKLTKLEWFL